MSVPISHLVCLQNGCPFASENFDSTGQTPLVRIRDLSSDEFETYLPFGVPDSQSLEDGDLVVGMDGEFSAQIWNRGHAALNQRLARLRSNGNSDIRYIAYALPKELQRIHDTQFATTVKHLSSGEILRCRVPDRPVDEQRRIADFLDDRVSRIDRIIAARREQMVQAREDYESMRRSLVLGANGPDVSSTDLPWAQFVGSDRIVRRLAQMATMGTGHTPSRSNADYWVDCTIPWLTTSDVHRFRRDEIDEINDTEILISELGLANSAAVLHPAGTVALSRTASAGFSIVMGTDMATSQDFVTWTCGPDLEPHFLVASLRVMRPFLLGYLATGSTHQTIYFPDLMDLRLPVPTVTTQRQAVDAIQAAADDYWSGDDAMQRQVDLLKEYKSSLITAAVTGELDVSTAGSSIPG